MSCDIRLLPFHFSNMERDSCVYNSLYTNIWKANRQNTMFKQYTHNAVYIQMLGL